MNRSSIGEKRTIEAASKPIRLGLVGLGSYGQWMCEMVNRWAAEDPANCAAVIAAVCEPMLESNPDRVAALQKQGVAVHREYEQLLAEPIDAVWLPVPIHLHLPFTEKALAAGKAVLCEKPAAGTVQEVDAMIAARNQYMHPVAIGYQMMFDPATAVLKRKLLDDRLGRIRSATVIACWPRNSAYYARNSWAGKMQFEGHWVLDSPLSNALSHFLQWPLFLLGDTESESAQPVRVEAELYRANPIDNFDTCSVRVALNSGATLLVLLTHACANQIDPEIHIIGEKGSAVIQHERGVIWTSPGDEPPISLSSTARQQMLASFRQCVHGNKPSGVVCTLEAARVPVVVVNAASEATAVRTIDAQHVRTIQTDGSHTLRAIIGIEEAMQSCARQSKMLHESGLATWSAPAGAIETAAYHAFRGPAEK